MYGAVARSWHELDGLGLSGSQGIQHLKLGSKE